MKRSICLLFHFVMFFSLNLTAQSNLFPEAPWKAIVETKNKKFRYHWQNDITVKLMGNYTTEDSVLMANAVQLLDSLTESIDLDLTDMERGHIEVYFLDNSNTQYYQNFVSPDGWNANFDTPDKLSSFRYSILKTKCKIEKRANYYTNKLVLALYPHTFVDATNSMENSIFYNQSVNKRDQCFLESPDSKDLQLIKAIYANNFETTLQKAKYTFKIVPWWMNTKMQPILIFAICALLLLLLTCYTYFARWMNQKVMNRFARLNIHGVIWLTILVFIGFCYNYISYGIEWGFFSSPFFKQGSLFIWGLVLVLGLIAINFFRYIEIITQRKKLFVRLNILFFSTSLIPVLTLLLIIYFTVPADELIESQSLSVLGYLFLLFIILAALRTLIAYFIMKEKAIVVENDLKLSKLRELKSRAELNALHSSINPHFLYNSLNSIAGLAHLDVDKTERMALSLARLFRYSINKDKSDFICIKEELEMVRVYLDVESIRFEDRLSFTVDVAPELEKEEMPRFLIQPLVENAIKHGISTLVDKCFIKVAIRKKGDDLVISVADNGPAFPDDLMPGFGVQSIYDKLDILYPQMFEINFINKPTKQVTIKLTKDASIKNTDY